MSRGIDLKIRAVPSPDPAICRFEVSQPLIPSGSLYFNRQSYNADLGLVEAIFNLPQVEEVAIEKLALVVRKSDTKPWSLTAKAIGSAIRENLDSTYSQMLEELEQKPSNTAGIEGLVEEILKSRINPSIASHGGRITLLEVKESRAYITMEGGCQGCSMSRVTLKNGVEKTLLEEIPELVEVVDMTDHSQGENPYHR